uniref:Hypothetical chloroplast RF1 n=1 Tax=Chlamydomonas peterfii TaxID=28462 RepID=A0A0S2ICW5_9CHLO|nr:hypothetical chloroplast RF1 [Chlamydomonas peterfii]
MLTVLSLVTSVKDYIEIAHKLIESQNGNLFLNSALPESLDLVGLQSATNLNIAEAQKQAGLLTSFLNKPSLNNYTEFGAVLTYVVLSFKQFLTSFFSFTWLSQIWSLPLIVPDIASAMISEVSVLDSYFTKAFFLETSLNASGEAGLASSIATQSENYSGAGLAFGKFVTGFINSLFFVLPTSTAHLITLRRFVIQGLEAGYIAGLGTIAGNVLWLASIILGWRFIVIPWLSFDVFRYILGFCLLVKYLWDSYGSAGKDFNKTSGAPNSTKVLENNTKKNIFLLNFLLALTEQTCIYPFISNISFGPEGSILESFSGVAKPAAVGTMLQTYSNNGQMLDFLTINFADGCYLLGILLGCFSLLQFTVWFWENPAFSMYMWMITSYRVTTSSYYKVLNFIFLYLTMLCAISSIPYFGFDYTLTNPLGLIPQDRIIDTAFTTVNGSSEKFLQETAFLGLNGAPNPTDKNSRIRDGIHARRERWKERLIKYQAFDASLYDQGSYDILTIEDLNYGFERFWLRRKLRNHQIRFRLFPGPWMRSLKKQLNKPGFSGPRVEFFRILFEQYYHPIFHATAPNQFRIRREKTVSGFTAAPENSKARGLDVAVNAQKATPLPAQQNQSLFAVDKAEPFKNQLLRNNALPAKNVLVGSIKAVDSSNVSALRKFARNFNNRLNVASGFAAPEKTAKYNFISVSDAANPIYSKSLKNLFSKINKSTPETATISALQGKKLYGFKKFTSKIFKNADKKERLLLSNKMFLLNNGIAGILNSEATYGSAVTNPADAALLPYNLTLPSLSGSAATTSILGRPFGASLEPLKLYLRKDEAFKRKLKYYSTTAIRNLSVGNNSPYLKTLLKRAFYYHKPSLRWKRTMFTAAMRRGFRKKSSSPKKLVYTTNALTESSMVTPALAQNLTELEQNRSEPAIFTKTASYSVLGKKASRYRYQIYKDVLQHWYYSPFNRLLLKFDIDSFINRQPKNHFLTKKEENLLHFRRVLLSEHYNSLRWYTYMQHYNTMKSNIGSTKSFASTVYNQQFQGTFQKIRHLFAITPITASLSEAKNEKSGSETLPILKFDQPLYNPFNASYGFAGTGIADVQNRKYNLLPTYLHEGLNSTLHSADHIAPQYMQNGVAGNSQNNQNAGLKIAQDNATFEYGRSDGTNQSSGAFNIANNKEILVTLLKECKRRLNDQAFLKNYIMHRIDKREQRKNEVQNELEKNLQLFQNWLSPIYPESTPEGLTVNQFQTPALAQKAVSPSGGESLLMQTTGVRKALNDGVFVLNNITANKKQIASLYRATGATATLESLKNNINYQKQNYLLLNFTKEEKIKQTLQSIKALTPALEPKVYGGVDSLLQTLTRFRLKITNLVKQTLNYNKVFAAKTEKSIEWWKQKQRVMTKRKASRKKARFQNIKSSLEQNAKVNPAELYSAVNKIYNFAGYNSLMSGELKSNNYGFAGKQAVSDVFKANVPENQTLAPQATLSATLRKKQYGNQNISGSPVVDNIGGFANGLPENNPEVSADAAPTQKSTKKQGSRVTNMAKLFFKKFNSKKSSPRYRYMYGSAGNSRGFAYVRRPKNKAVPVTIENTTPENANLQAITAPKSGLKKAFTFLNGYAGLDGSIPKRYSGSDFLMLKRTWKNRKRHKFTKNHSKYRKRKIHSSGKIRNLNKKLKRIQATVELQNWWWNVYLPNYITTAQSKSGKSGVAVNRPSVGLFTGNASAIFENAGEISFKPLSTNKALDIRAELSAELSTELQKPAKEEPLQKKPLNIDGSGALNLLNTSTAVPAPATYGGSGLATEKTNTLQNYNTTNIPFYAGWDESLRKFVVTNRLLSRRDTGFRTSVYNVNAFAFTNQSTSEPQPYAGIEENSSSATTKPYISQTLVNKKAKAVFTKAPIQGLNEGSFLYLQTEMPFNSYIIDQFIPNNQSFYAPLGWKRFQFRHSLFKNWQNDSKAVMPEGNKNLYNNLPLRGKNGFTGSVFFTAPREKTAALGFSQENYKNSKILQKKLAAGRIQKRYKLLKQTPIQLMYVPTGALLNDILPSHYVSVFDKQYRVPRNIYLKRYLPSATKAGDNAVNSIGTEKINGAVGVQSAEPYSTVLEYSNSAVQYGQYPPIDLTLRKKIKPRRKYHKKRFYKKDGLIFPRRQKFSINTASGLKNQVDYGIVPNAELQSDVPQAYSGGSGFRLRPSTKYSGAGKSNISGGAVGTAKYGGKAKKILSKPVRLRQLRNREFKQVLKPLQKFQPRSGGFVWPGDYLRFEIVPMPKFNYGPNRLTVTNTEKTGVGLNTKAVQKTKRKINVQPIGLLPRKYLLQKHNLKVLKKKLYLSNS